MNRFRPVILFFFAVIAGLIVNMGVYSRTNSVTSEIPESIALESNLCGSNLDNYPDEPIGYFEETISGGAPFESRNISEPKPLRKCDPQEPPSSKELLLKNHISTTEFYANWLVWSTATIGALLVGKKTYAHYRD